MKKLEAAAEAKRRVIEDDNDNFDDVDEKTKVVLEKEEYDDGGEIVFL